VGTSDSKRRRRADVPVWLVLGLGIVTTGLGVAYAVAATPAGVSVPDVGDGVVAGILSSLGAGVVGAALSIILTRPSDREVGSDLVAVVANSLNARFVSAAENLELVRKDWHHYHVTSLGGTFVWRYIRTRLDQSAAENSLDGRVNVADAGGRMHDYTVEAGVRGTHGILFISGRTGGPGAGSTEVFPGLTRAYQPIHSGLGVFETWDGIPTVGKVILSRDPLVPEHDGQIDDIHFPLLEDVWARHFPPSDHLFPTAAAAQPATGSTGAQTQNHERDDAIGAGLDASEHLARG